MVVAVSTDERYNIPMRQDSALSVFSNESSVKGIKEVNLMLGTLKINIAPEEIIKAIKCLGKKERTALLEEILAGTSPEYLKGIKEARMDYKAGRIKTHNEVFDE